jgi:hypothetical protein
MDTDSMLGSTDVNGLLLRNPLSVLLQVRESLSNLFDLLCKYVLIGGRLSR